MINARHHLTFWKVWRSLMFLIMLVSLAFSAMACSNGINNGPLILDDGSSGCSSYNKTRAGDLFSLSIMFPFNQGEFPLTISCVSLIKPENMEIVETSLMEVGEERTLIGFVKWPLKNLDNYPHFNDRVTAKGATIEPGEGFNLIFVVKLTADTAHADGLRIDYETADGSRYYVNSYYGYEFTPE